MLLFASLAACAGAQTHTPPLPFDTTGAQRGALPNRFESSTVKWIGGDTLVREYVTVFDRMQPPTIEPRVFGTDTSATRLVPRMLPLAPCPFELRLYRSLDDSAPVWDSKLARRALACPPLASRMQGEKFTRLRIDAILGDSLTDARYALGLTVRLAGGRQLSYDRTQAYLGAHPRAVTRDLSALRFAAGSALEGQAPRMLTAWAVARNTGATAVELQYGACALQIRLWRSAARAGPPVWLSERREPVRPKGWTKPPHYACPAMLLSSVIGPGDTLPFRLAVPFPEVLADSLPNGEYLVGVDLSVLNDTLGSARREIHYALPAGQLMLRRAPDKPPTVRLENGIRFEAATRVSRGPTHDADTIHTFVMITNTTDSVRVLQIDRGTPIMVSIFRSAEDRDAYPPARPVYTLFTGSGFLTQQRLTLGAGRKWLVEQSAAVKEVVRRAGRGRLYFLASVTGTPLTLAAGDVEVP